MFSARSRLAQPGLMFINREDIQVAVAIATHLSLAIDRWKQSQQLKWPTRSWLAWPPFPN